MDKVSYSFFLCACFYYSVVVIFGNKYINSTTYFQI
jgi:hypothetical protein